MPKKTERPTADEKLVRAVEQFYTAIPARIRDAYEHDELVNGLFLLLKTRNVREVSRIKIRYGAIDFHRSRTRYRGDFFRSKTGAKKLGKKDRLQKQRHGDEIPTDKLPERPRNNGKLLRIELVEELAEIRKRMGTDGLMVFLLVRIMELDNRSVTEIMGWSPDSLLGKSIQDMGDRT